jgi:hypothetical protein
MSKACPNLTPVESSANAEYLLDIALDANGAANGTLAKSGNVVWSDSYDSNFYHYSDRGKLNGKLLVRKLGATFCRANKAAKIISAPHLNQSASWWQNFRLDLVNHESHHSDRN